MLLYISQVFSVFFPSLQSLPELKLLCIFLKSLYSFSTYLPVFRLGVFNFSLHWPLGWSGWNRNQTVWLTYLKPCLSFAGWISNSLTPHAKPAKIWPNGPLQPHLYFFWLRFYTPTSGNHLQFTTRPPPPTHISHIFFSYTTSFVSNASLPTSDPGYQLFCFL